MEIIVGKTAGFCYGVKRAVDGCFKEIEKNKDSNNIYCLGEIVHNQNVVKELENNGMTIIENIEDSDNLTILRAHGVPKKVYQYAQSNNIKLVDLTCPNVLKIHEIANLYSSNGYHILLCGSRKHPENIGTLSYCGKNVDVIESKEDVFKIIDKLREDKKILLISQTTFSLEKFLNIKNILEENLGESKLEVKNTICMATKIRQEETKKIASSVDYMIIIGGKNSSNTKKLYDIAKKECENSTMIQDKNDLDINNISKFNKIGIMAGASTPQKDIEEVVKIIKSSDK